MGCFCLDMTPTMLAARSLSARTHIFQPGTSCLCCTNSASQTKLYTESLQQGTKCEASKLSLTYASAGGRTSEGLADHAANETLQRKQSRLGPIKISTAAFLKIGCLLT
eukprot:777431-Amphidinium_carterae.1